MVAFNTALPRLSDASMPHVATDHAEHDSAVAGRIGFDRQPVATGIDRRIHPRQAVSLRVQGRRDDHTIDAMRMPHLNLSIEDVSVGGLRAKSQTPLGVGERVSVYFPPSGGSQGWNAHGRVLRATPDFSTAGCTVAVEFDALPAA